MLGEVIRELANGQTVQSVKEKEVGLEYRNGEFFLPANLEKPRRRENAKDKTVSGVSGVSSVRR